MAIREFEMTDADLAALMQASQPVMAIALNAGPMPSVQENANRAWKALGDKMGFDHMTVRPSRSNQPRFFYAAEKEAGRG